MKYNKNHELYKHLHICLVEDHYNPLGIIRSLGEAGISPIVLLCTKHPQLVNFSKYVKKIYKFNSIKNAFKYLVEKYSNEPYKPFIYNGSDETTLILDKHYNYLKDKFYFCNGKGFIEKYLQKYDITLLAKECGFRIPKEEFKKKGELPNDLEYPVITKASTSSKGGDWKADSFICNSKSELIEAYKKIKSKNVLVQEFIKKKNEYCIDGISINGGEEIYLPYAAQYFRFSDKSYGAYMYFERVKNNKLINKIQNIIKGSKYSGIFCIEFLIGNDNKLYFLEVNFRNSGWSYAFTYGGFNLPYMWAKSTIDGHITMDDIILTDKHFTAMSEFEDYNLVVNEQQQGFRKWFKDFIRADCKFFYNKKDPLPFWNVVIKKVISKPFRVVTHKFGKNYKK
ncbi:MAG: ATP-grasp domain-containing protein [Lachnospiraceae bacterium]|nr:ATP-grasp domain-containing protein [Lachnospiraceae bacterium]